jgi:hypothetical protein
VKDKQLHDVLIEMITCPPLLFAPDANPEPTPEERIAEAIEEIRERDK